MFEDLIEKKLKSEEVFDGGLLHVFKDEIELPNRDKSCREWIQHIGAVCVVPVTDAGEVILEHQFRYPISEVITEIPAGKLDSKEEDRLEAAKRELREETGYEADHWTDMGIYYPAAAYSDEKITMYLAEGLHRGSQELDEDEFLEVYKQPIEETVKEILEGKITDGKTQVAVLKAAALLEARKK